MTRFVVRRFRSCVAVLSIAAAFLAAVQLQSQSPAVPNGSGLEVRGVEYDATNGSVKYELANETDKHATAYGVDIIVFSAGKQVVRTGYDTDLLNLVVNARRAPGAEDSWSGALQAGDSRNDVTSANVPKETQNAGPVEVHVALKMVFWSDGSVWTDGSVDNADNSRVKRIKTARVATLRAEEKLLAILQAHNGDPEAAAQIAGIVSDINDLLKPNPHQASRIDDNLNLEARSPSDTIDDSVLSMAVNELNSIRARPDAKAQFAGYVLALRAEHERRAALVQIADTSSQEQ